MNRCIYATTRGGGLACLLLQPGERRAAASRPSPHCLCAPRARRIFADILYCSRERAAEIDIYACLCPAPSASCPRSFGAPRPCLQPRLLVAISCPRIASCPATISCLSAVERFAYRGPISITRFTTAHRESFVLGVTVPVDGRRCCFHTMNLCLKLLHE